MDQIMNITIYCYGKKEVNTEILIRTCNILCNTTTNGGLSTSTQIYFNLESEIHVAIFDIKKSMKLSDIY